MSQYGRKVSLSLFAMVLLFGSLLLPVVSAAYTAPETETTTQTLETASNGHFYLYEDRTPTSLFTHEYLSHDEDINWKKYDYSHSSWSTEVGSADGPARRSFE
ncbi:MAG: hypothetical protein GF411_12640, partial [Candidatus Lokiarchaeota archaeon]|nr:hypothetical protein [Candidatus Lokiarchaeota archaeon]